MQDTFPEAFKNINKKQQIPLSKCIVYDYLYNTATVCTHKFIRQGFLQGTTIMAHISLSFFIPLGTAFSTTGDAYKM